MKVCPNKIKILNVSVPYRKHSYTVDYYLGLACLDQPTQSAAILATPEDKKELQTHYTGRHWQLILAASCVHMFLLLFPVRRPTCPVVSRAGVFGISLDFSHISLSLSPSFSFSPSLSLSLSLSALSICKMYDVYCSDRRHSRVFRIDRNVNRLSKCICRTLKRYAGVVNNDINVYDFLHNSRAYSNTRALITPFERSACLPRSE